MIKGLRPDQIVLDSEATIHGTPMASLCFDKKPCSMYVGGITGTPFHCTMMGKIVFRPQASDGVTPLPVILSRVYISPHFPATFVSESLLTSRGATIIKKGAGGAVLTSAGDLLFKVARRDGLYFAVGEIATNQLAKDTPHMPPTAPSNARQEPSAEKKHPETKE